MPKQFRRGYRDNNPTLALRFMQTAPVSLSVFDAMNARHAFMDAKSSNGLTSLRLHSVRQELATKLAPSLNAFDEIQQRFAKKDDAGAPVVRPGLSLIPSRTPAYEADPAKAAELAAELLPLLQETLTIVAPSFTEAHAEQINAAVDIGSALIHFMEK